MVLEELAQEILSFVDWGRTILMFMLVIEIWRFITFGGTVGSGISNIGQWVKGIPGRYKRRSHQRLLNDYILEEREEKDFDELKRKALRILTQLEDIASRKAISFTEKSDIVQDIQDFGEELTKTKRVFRDMNKTTARADNGLDQLFAYFKKEGIKVPDEVKALENNILLLHQQTGQELASVEGVYEKIVKSQAMDGLDSLEEDVFGDSGFQIIATSKPFNEANLQYLIKGFQNEKFLLEDAYKRQAEAKKEMTGIIAETRGLYE